MENNNQTNSYIKPILLLVLACSIAFIIGIVMGVHIGKKQVKVFYHTDTITVWKQSETKDSTIHSIPVPRHHNNIINDTSHFVLYDTVKVSIPHFTFYDTISGMSKDSVSKYFVRHTTEYLTDSVRSRWVVNIENTIPNRTIYKMTYVPVIEKAKEPFYSDNWFWATMGAVAIIIIKVL
jgi:hypothetical protein